MLAQLQIPPPRPGSGLQRPSQMKTALNIPKTGRVPRPSRPKPHPGPLAASTLLPASEGEGRPGNSDSRSTGCPSTWCSTRRLGARMTPCQGNTGRGGKRCQSSFWRPELFFLLWEGRASPLPDSHSTAAERPGPLKPRSQNDQESLWAEGPPACSHSGTLATRYLLSAVPPGLRRRPGACVRARAAGSRLAAPGPPGAISSPPPAPPPQG